MLAFACSVGLASAEELSEPGFEGNKVIPQAKADPAGVPNKQVIANIYEVPAGNMVPRHFHHGDEFHLVLSGSWEAEVEGRAARILKAGDSQYVAGGLWHGGRALGPDPLRLLGIMIVDKDKPITEVVPGEQSPQVKLKPTNRS
ncbi:MAG TPA: cupin domain-containing protein [Stellaceae bacterium]|jgi:quercetin dioxygenase-like cupin family protein|nr:cupin domain-containing protein [Stellaceae bacterium]